MVIAGLVSREDAKNVRKLPGLGQIPILGELFKSREFRKQQTELVVLVTPRIIDTGSAPNRQYQERFDELNTQADETPVVPGGRLTMLNGNAMAHEEYEALTPVRKEIQECVQDQLDLYKRNLITGMSVEELRDEASRVANKVLVSGAVKLPGDVKPQQIAEQVVAESIGLGPIEPLLQDESISEVMVNGPQDVYIEQQGRIKRVPVRFIDARSLMSVIEAHRDTAWAAH